MLMIECLLFVEDVGKDFGIVVLVYLFLGILVFVFGFFVMCIGLLIGENFVVLYIGVVVMVVIVVFVVI